MYMYIYTSVNVEHRGASLSKQSRAASVGYSLIARLQHTGHPYLQLAGVKSRLLLTSIDSEHTVLTQIGEASKSCYA